MKIACIVDHDVFSPVKRDTKRDGGRPKKILGDVIKRDLWINGIVESEIGNNDGILFM